jgi:predicted nucleic acid-binding protein
MSRVFIDANVLVYADQPSSDFHSMARHTLMGLEAAEDELWISRQVLREYQAVITRPNPAAPHLNILTPADAVEAVRSLLETFCVAEDGPLVTDHRLSLIARRQVAGRRTHDANTVATMLAHGISRLATFNVRDFHRFMDLIDIESVERS